MSLLQQLVDAQQDARKTQNKERLSVLQMALSAIKKEKIDAQKDDMSDDDIVAILRRQIKQLTDALKDFEAGGRDDLVAQNKAEIDILSEFVPAQLSEEKIEEIVKTVIADIKPSGPQDFGRVMGAVMAQVNGQADGQVVSAAVRRLMTS